MERYTSDRARNRTAGGNTFARDIYRAYLKEFNTVADYIGIAIALSGQLPATARLFDEVARVELSHHEQLGQLLLHLGQEPQMQLHLRQEPMRHGKNGTLQAPLSAKHMLEAKIAAERADAAEYKRLSAATSNAAIRRMLLEISAEEEGHATAFEGMLNRLGRS